MAGTASRPGLGFSRAKVADGADVARAGARAGLGRRGGRGALLRPRGQSIWADEQLLSADRVRELGSALKPAVVLNWDCNSGWFADLWGNSVSEELLLTPDGGALATFGPVGITSPAAQRMMYEAFYPELYGGQTLGEVIVAAKRAAVTEAPGRPRRHRGLRAARRSRAAASPTLPRPPTECPIPPNPTIRSSSSTRCTFAPTGSWRDGSPRSSCSFRWWGGGEPRLDLLLEQGGDLHLGAPGRQDHGGCHRHRPVLQLRGRATLKRRRTSVTSSGPCWRSRPSHRSGASGRPQRARPRPPNGRGGTAARSTERSARSSRTCRAPSPRSHASREEGSSGRRGAPPPRRHPGDARSVARACSRKRHRPQGTRGGRGEARLAMPGRAESRQLALVAPHDDAIVAEDEGPRTVSAPTGGPMVDLPAPDFPQSRIAPPPTTRPQAWRTTWPSRARRWWKTSSSTG